MSVINTNVKSIMAQNALSVNNRSLSKAMEQLSTGKRINGAADDAAGLAIASKMEAQIRGLDQGVRNANDAISMIQTAEGATKEISNMLQRMRELSVQAANDTYATQDRNAIGTEITQLKEEIDRVATNSEWNGRKILGSDAGTYTYQVGSGSTSTSSVSVTFSGMSATALGVQSLSMISYGGATSAISSVDAAIQTVDTFRATLGAKINRMESSVDNLANIAMNTSASRSRIEDTDYAAATTELARTQIIQQAATAMLAQANQQPQAVLSLLRRWVAD
jgi:flagellin